MPRFLFISAVILGMALVITVPLWDERMFSSDCGMLPLYYVSQMHRNAIEGNGLARWCPDFALGLGSPGLVFVPPLPYFTAFAFRLAGAPVVAAVKWTFAVAVLLAGIGTYLWAQRMWGLWGGLLAAGATLMSPYFLYVIYQRGDLGEALAFALFPWLLWVARHLIASPSRGPSALLAFLFAAMVMSHFPFALLATPVLLAFIAAGALAFANRQALGWGIAAIILGFGAGMGSWLPIVFERDQLALTHAATGVPPAAGLPLTVSQLFLGGTTELGGTAGALGQLSLGAAVLVLALAGLTVAVRYRLFQQECGFVVIFAGIAALISIVLALPVSAPLWDRLPGMDFVQFPYRALAFAALFAAFLAGGAVELPAMLLRWLRPALALVALTVLAIASQRHLAPHGFIEQRTVTSETVRQARTTLLPGSPLPQGVRHLPEALWSSGQAATPANFGWTNPMLRMAGQTIIPQQAAVVSGHGTISGFLFNGARMEMHAMMATPGAIRVGTLYFPGWYALVDDVRMPVLRDPATNLIRLTLDQGVHKVVLRFGSTALRRRSALLSLAVVALLTGLLLTGFKTWHWESADSDQLPCVLRGRMLRDAPPSDAAASRSRRGLDQDLNSPAKSAGEFPATENDWAAGRSREGDATTILQMPVFTERPNPQLPPPVAPAAGAVAGADTGTIPVNINSAPAGRESASGHPISATPAHGRAAAEPTVPEKSAKIHGFRGLFRIVPLPDALNTLQSGLKTGCLLCSFNGGTWMFYLRNGTLIYGSGPFDHSALLEELRQHPRLSPEILRQALTRGLEGDTLIRFLVELRTLNREDLGNLIRMRIIRMLAEGAVARDGEYEFIEGKAPSDPVLEVELDVPFGLLLAAQMVDERRQITSVPDGDHQLLELEEQTIAFNLARPRKEGRGSRQKQGQLVHYVNEVIINTYLLGSGSMFIGRGESADIQLPQDRTISRMHAKLTGTRGQYFIEDLGSINGVIVNGQPIRRHELKDGDRIVIGDHLLVFGFADESTSSGREKRIG